MFIFLKYSLTMKITQKQIAEATGLSAGSISALFNGERPGGKVIRQLISFGISPMLVTGGTSAEIVAAIYTIIKRKEKWKTKNTSQSVRG